MGSEHTRRAYQSAWADVLAFTGKPVEAVDEKDLARWAKHLQARGLSAATCRQRIAAVNSYLSFTGQRAELPRPKAKQAERYEKAVALSVDETRALLRAIAQDTPQGRRDYALFLGYLFTARRNSEWRAVCWGDVTVRGRQVTYRWTARGEEHCDELPTLVWDAVRAYLQSVDRLETIRPEEAIFTALSDHAERLPSVGPRSSSARPALSMREVGRLLKKYCRRARLDPQRVCVQTLRHTAALLRQTAGDSAEAICKLLDQRAPRLTQTYLRKVAAKQDTSWARVQDMLKL